MVDDYVVDFRDKPACPCLAQWLPAYELELQRRGVLTGKLRIYQLIGTASASGGTHSKGGSFDISDLVGEEDVWVARQMGADATWARTEAQGFTPHLHGVLRGCPHNLPARYQIAAVDAGYNGLGRNGHGATDDGPRPLSGRTWQEGVEWARRQREEWIEMPEMTRDQLQGAIREAVFGIKVPAPPGSKAEKHYGKGAKLSLPNAVYWALAESVGDAKEATLKALAQAVEELEAEG